MRKIIAFMLIGVIVFLTGCTTQPSESTYKQINADEAVEIMNKETDYIILDVRTQEEYNSGHIHGAVCIPNESIGNESPSLLPDKNQLILVYCRSGNRSKQAAQKLADLGYTNIVEFGGINDWKGDIETDNL